MQIKSLVLATICGSLLVGGCDRGNHARAGDDHSAAEMRRAEMTWVVPVSASGTATSQQVVAAMRTMDQFYATQPGFVRSDMLENKLDDGNATYAHVSVWKDRKSWEAMMSGQAFAAKQDEVIPVVTLNLARAYRKID